MTPSIKNCPKIPMEKIKLLWHGEYYDGMLAGFLEYENKVYYFKCVEHNEDLWDEATDWFKDTWYRRFFIFSLKAEEIAEVIKRQERFEKYVGDHNTYKDNKRTGTCKIDSDWSQYYDWAKANPGKDLAQPDRIIGWFEN